MTKKLSKSCKFKSLYDVPTRETHTMKRGRILKARSNVIPHSLTCSQALFYTANGGNKCARNPCNPNCRRFYFLYYILHYILIYSEPVFTIRTITMRTLLLSGNYERLCYTFFLLTLVLSLYHDRYQRCNLIIF